MSFHAADLRPRMTCRACHVLERGEPWLVAGGPLSGKSTMLRHLGALLPGCALHDDITPDALADLAGSGGCWGGAIDAGLLWKLGSPPGVRIVPLVNLAAADLRSACTAGAHDYDELLRWSAGHPSLVANYRSDETWRMLGVRLQRALAGLPEAYDTWGTLRALPEAAAATGDPVALHAAARRLFGADCKRRLDPLAGIGALTRSIVDEHAALRLVPIPAAARMQREERR